MCHIPQSRSFCTARVAASVATTFSLFVVSDGFQVGPYHLVGGRQRLFSCPRSLARVWNRWGSSVATMCAPGGEVAPETHAKPSVGAEVALTREAGKNAKLASLLEEAGVSSVEIPCIRHQDGPDLPLLPTALEDKDLAYVVITSPEAAKVFLSGWNQAGQPTMPVACVGKATSEALEKSGVTPVFIPTKATGETLAAELPFPEAATGAERGRLVLYPASSRAQETIEAGLTARGFNVRRLNTYDTVPAEWDSGAEAAAKAASVAAFGSPSAVKTWARKMGVAPGTNRQGTGDALAACIGKTSARACREAGWADSAIFYPEKPGMEGWARAVLDALETIKASSREAVP